jgi:hypothetical protein
MRRGNVRHQSQFEQQTQRPFHPSALHRNPLRSKLLQTVPQLGPLRRVFLYVESFWPKRACYTLPLRTALTDG